MRKLKLALNAFPALVGLIILGWIAFAHPTFILHASSVTMLFGALLIIFLFMPFAKSRLGDTPVLSFKQWLGKLILAQLGVLILFFAAIIAFFGAGPQFAHNQITLQTAVQTLQTSTLTQWGLFPWSVYALWGLILAYNVFVKKGLPFFYHNAAPFCHKRIAPFYKNFVNFSTSSSILMVMSFAIVSVVLLLSYFIQTNIAIHHFAVPLVTVLLIYPAIVLHAIFGKRFYRKISKRQLPLLLSSIFIVIIGVVVLTLAAIGNGWFIQQHPEIMNQLECKECEQYLNAIPVETRLAAFYFGWWIMWAPIAGSYLAKISQGRTIREYVLGILFFPSLLLCLGIFSPGFFETLMVLLWLIPTQWVLCLTGLSAMIVICMMLKTVKSQDWFNAGMLLPEAGTRRSRISLYDGAKTASMRHYAQRLATTVLIILLLHVVTGWYGIQFQLTAMAFISIEVLLLGTCFFMVQLFKDRQTKPSQQIEIVKQSDG